MPQLPGDILPLVAEQLWIGGLPKRSELRAREAFDALSLAGRELHEACAALRWSKAAIRTRRWMQQIEQARVLFVPSIAGRVRSLTIALSPYEARDGDIIASVLSALSRLEHFVLRSDGYASNSVAVDALSAVFERVTIALSELDHSALRGVSLVGGGPQADLGVAGTQALGRILRATPQLTTLSLCRLALRGATLGLAAAEALPHLTRFWAVSLARADAIAGELGRCLGVLTAYVSMSSTAWPTAMAILAGAAPGLVSAGHGGERIAWTAWSATTTLDAALDVFVHSRGCLEAIRGSSTSVVWELHATRATSRRIAKHHCSTEAIAARLTDLSYGRFLDEITVHESSRDPGLEAICDRRGISINYCPCAGPRRDRLTSRRYDSDVPTLRFVPSNARGTLA